MCVGVCGGVCWCVCGLVMLEWVCLLVSVGLAHIVISGGLEFGKHTISLGHKDRDKVQRLFQKSNRAEKPLSSKNKCALIFYLKIF